MKVLRIFKWPKVTLPEENTRVDFDAFLKLSAIVKDDILRNAEIRFDGTIDNINRVKDISYKLITLFVSLLGILVTLYFNDNISLNWLDKKVYTSLYLVNISVVVYAIVQLVNIIRPREQMLKGEEPRIMKYDNLASLSDEDQILNWKYGSINVLQTKIYYNDLVLEILTNRFEHVILTSTSIFVVTLILSIINQSM